MPSQEHPLSTRAVLLVTLGACAVLLFPTIFWPFDYDQGTFAYGGSAILHGQRPYIDFWDIKPPNIFYTYATAFALFGQSVRAVRIFDYLNALLTLGLLTLIATRLWKDRAWRNVAAMFTALAFILQYYIFGHWDTAQAETYSVPFLLMAMLLVIPNRETTLGQKPWLRAALAGACVGITFYFKFPNALFLALVAAAIWARSGVKRRTQWHDILWMLAGFAAVIGAQSVYLAANGEFLPLWQITTSSTASYVSTNYSGSFGILQNIRASFHALDLLWVAFGLFGWGVWASNRKQREDTASIVPSALLVVFGCVIAYAIVQAQNKGFTYHYAVLLPWADFLIGAGLVHLARGLGQIDRLPLSINAVILGMLLWTLSFTWSSRAVLHERANEFSAMLRDETEPNGYVAGDSLVNYVLANSKATDRIFIFGFAPYVYWKTGRQPATKFLNTIHFKPATVPQAERDELVTSLLRNPPELFLVETRDRYTSQGNTNDDSRTTIALRYPELEQLLHDRYAVQDTVQSTIAYQLRH